MDTKDFEKFINAEIPTSTPVEEVIFWLKNHNYEFSKIHEQKIFSSTIAKKRLFMTAKWLMVFHFDQNNQLTKIDVRKDYIAL